MPLLVLATRNAHKAEEIRSILGDDYRCLTMRELAAAPELIEDAATFAGNATRKAVQLAKFLSLHPEVLPVSIPEIENASVVADDSGLEVDALNGAPGVHSARFAAAASGRPGNSPDAENNARLLTMLAGVPSEKRTARFRCVLALTPLLKPRPQAASPTCVADEFELQTRLFEGACEGKLRFGPSGRGGFGYDPLFVPEGHDLTFAELGPELKNALSHRALALRALKTALANAPEN